MVRSPTGSGWSAVTQVKAVSPEICIAKGQGLLCPEASIVVGVSRRVYGGMPGSWATAGHPTECIGTWEDRIACLPQRAEEARRGQGDTAVGPAHSRGVAGVMPGAGRPRPDPLEGAGGQLHRDPNARPILRDGNASRTRGSGIRTSPNPSGCGRARGLSARTRPRVWTAKLPSSWETG